MDKKTEMIGRTEKKKKTGQVLLLRKNRENGGNKENLINEED